MLQIFNVPKQFDEIFWREIPTDLSCNIFCVKTNVQKVWENEGLQIENMAEHFVIYDLRHFGRCLLAILVLE